MNKKEKAFYKTFPEYKMFDKDYYWEKKYKLIKLKSLKSVVASFLCLNDFVFLRRDNEGLWYVNRETGLVIYLSKI